ncbi:MAG TPA: YhfC family glutamic-type intramembrane protease, partial [Anaerolineales bacterium]|nr:YhfC family glutamic-type intramembrane protease [Anaerolineales bacterium]
VRAGGYALLRRFKPAWMRLRDGIMLGLGHGGIEAMIFGGVLTAAGVSALLPLQGTDLETLGLNPEQLATLRIQLDALVSAPYSPLVPLVERVLAMAAHVTFSLLVWRAFANGRIKRDWYFIGIAVLYHMALDAVLVYAIQTWPDLGYWVELILAGMVLPGFVWAVSMARREGSGTPREGVRSNWGVFWVATRKEIRQLWRTKRFLVVGAVFLLFGMGSPLIAKLTPELLRSIEGAEMFADLIPEPTAGDAMAQYLKNLSQFGFIIAILIGMGAVAGEKERGVAPMILSKPMSRWAFITSKFAAQFAMYLCAFVLAGLGAYTYTVILFGALDFGAFALLNGLLLLWLMTFAALNLLGSTLGASTVAAGGIGLGLSVVMLVAGNIPRYGALFPGGLMAWATQLGLSAAGAAASALNTATTTTGMGANGGAAAGALAIIFMALVLSVGVFEQQEL